MSTGAHVLFSRARRDFFLRFTLMRYSLSLSLSFFSPFFASSTLSFGLSHEFQITRFGGDVAGAKEI